MYIILDVEDRMTLGELYRHKISINEILELPDTVEDIEAYNTALRLSFDGDVEVIDFIFNLRDNKELQRYLYDKCYYYTACDIRSRKNSYMGSSRSLIVSINGTERLLQQSANFLLCEEIPIGNSIVIDSGDGCIVVYESRPKLSRYIDGEIYFDTDIKEFKELLHSRECENHNKRLRRLMPDMMGRLDKECDSYLCFTSLDVKCTTDNGMLTGVTLNLGLSPIHIKIKRGLDYKEFLWGINEWLVDCVLALEEETGRVRLLF